MSGGQGKLRAGHPHRKMAPPWRGTEARSPCPHPEANEALEGGPTNDHPAWDLNATCPRPLCLPPPASQALTLGLKEGLVPEATSQVGLSFPSQPALPRVPQLSRGSWAAAGDRQVPEAWGCSGGRVGGSHTVRDLERQLRAETLLSPCNQMPWGV